MYLFCIIFISHILPGYTAVCDNIFMKCWRLMSKRMANL